ncbi:hypothetical protein [uncultured Roseobacter sp.]|uniref:hypothetical protein n=1 Tax=uncultured Roseobacter sp. TaxID=114847 RepID=UPI002630BA21|nr:hypothetical protein [uncultured Roseobacter sp.]
MSQMHNVTGPERQEQAEQLVGEMILALADHMHMTVPSAVFMVQQITARHLAHWHKPSAIKNLRLTARYFNGDLKYADFFKKQGALFDQITAGYEAEEGPEIH